LKAEWAAQRIKDLSLRVLLLRFLGKSKRTIRTLVDEFHYPKMGPGMMWQAIRNSVESRGGVVRLNTEAVRVLRDGNRVTAGVVRDGGQGEQIVGGDVLSSMPGSVLGQRVGPPGPSSRRGGRPASWVAGFHRCRPDHEPVPSFSGQLDLRPRSGGEGGTYSELQELEPGYGAGSRQVEPGSRVLLHRGRRSLARCGS